MLLATGRIAERLQSHYVSEMHQVASKFTGKTGVVLHLGDSITYAKTYGSWARYGKGKTAAESAVCHWMHTGMNDETDGWYLACVDRPFNRSETAASGVRTDDYLAGGKCGLPPLAAIIRKYNPQLAVIMLGTNDVKVCRPATHVKSDMAKILTTLIANYTIPILSTIPPIQGKFEAVEAVNSALSDLADEKAIPLIDYFGEILALRHNNWADADQ